MIYPPVDAKKWAKDHQIIIEKEKCPKCNYDVFLRRPIALNGYRGMEAEVCEKCGYDSKIFVVVPVSKEKIELWDTLRY